MKLKLIKLFIRFLKEKKLYNASHISDIKFKNDDITEIRFVFRNDKFPSSINVYNEWHNFLLTFGKVNKQLHETYLSFLMSNNIQPHLEKIQNIMSTIHPFDYFLTTVIRYAYIKFSTNRTFVDLDKRWRKVCTKFFKDLLT